MYTSARGIVAYLDVLGARGFDCERAVSFFEQRAKFQKELVTGFRSFEVIRTNTPEVVRFADTILIHWQEKEHKASQLLLHFLGGLQHAIAYAMGSSLLLRGAVAIGDYVTDGESSLLGPAMAEAARVEALANWSGVVLAPSAARTLVETRSALREGGHNYHFRLLQKMACTYSVPLKCHCLQPSCSSVVVGWPQLLINREKLLKGLTECHEDKKKNTILFYDWWHAVHDDLYSGDSAS